MEARILRCAVAPALLGIVAGSALADDIKVFGLSEGKAVVALENGKLKVLRPGDTLTEGIKLQAADRDVAVFMVQGKKKSFTIGQNVAVSTDENRVPRVTLTADNSGHFFANGSINGGQIRFLVDTGATRIFLGAGEARRLGINYLKGRRSYTSTANGDIMVYQVTLDTVQIGDVSASGVGAVVSENDDSPFALLGMTFLNRMRMDRDGDQLTLTKRF